jgi:hypothetical protein
VVAALRAAHIRALLIVLIAIHRLFRVVPHSVSFSCEGVVMHRLLICVLFLIAFHFSAFGVRAARLEAVWIGPGGNGGEGDWHTPSNWNLGVVPDNGIDADGDGVPDIFDVRIDNRPAAASLVHSYARRVEIAGLRVDEGDTLDLIEPLGLALRDPNGIDVTNNGLISLDGVGHVPALTFAGDSITLSGGGTLQLGKQRALPGILAALDGGRIINGAGHTIKTSGVMLAGRLTGFHPETSSRAPALTNHGTILAEDRSDLRIDLNDETHFNYGTIRTATRARAALSSNRAGGFHNHGLIWTTDGFTELRVEGLQFVNERDGIVRASESGAIRFAPTSGNTLIRNLGLIEANGGAIHIEGRNIVNEGQGVIQARAGGSIELSEGTFHPDPAIQVLDSQSELALGRGAIFENHNNVLSAGPGQLRIFGGAVRGGEVTSGLGTLYLWGARFEDVALRGSAIGPTMDLKGTITIDSGFTFGRPGIDGDFITVTRGDAILEGHGVSKFSDTTIHAPAFTLQIAPGHQAEFAELTVEGNLRNNGVILTNTARVAEGVVSGSGTFVSPFFSFERNGLLSPGDGIGTMSIYGRVQLSTLLAELGTSDADLLDITGNLQLGSSFAGANLVLAGGLVGESYLIAKYTGELVGAFDNVTPGYNVIYDDLAKQIRVEPIPEPASIALAMMGVVAAAVYLRSRTNRRSR